MLKTSKSVKTLEIQGARTYFVILFSGEMVQVSLNNSFIAACQVRALPQIFVFI